jgi:hypothetical protein
MFVGGLVGAAPSEAVTEVDDVRVAAILFAESGAAFDESGRERINWVEFPPLL